MSQTAICPGQRTYRLHRSDCAALLEQLEALQPEHQDICDIHALCFASYMDGAPVIDREGPCSAAYYSLQYLHQDPTYLFLHHAGSDTQPAMVTEEECRALLSGETDWLLARHNPLLRSFHDDLTENMFLPRTLLNCTRRTMTLPGGCVRFALHTDYRTAMPDMDFLDPQQLLPKLTPFESGIFLRITADGEIPDEILCMIREAAPRRRRTNNLFLPV